MKLFFLISFLSLYITLGSVSLVIAQDSTKAGTEQDQGQQTKIEHGQNFIDEDGDGYNDNAPDHDGDGIPNGLDPDYQKLKKQYRKGNRHKFVDLDGDGINDNLQEEEEKEKIEQGKQQLGQEEKGSSLDQKGEQGSGEGKRKRAGRK
jgi:hypothetical protein